MAAEGLTKPPSADVAKTVAAAVAPVDLGRRIEFHLERKPYSPISSSANQNFHLETLNPSSSQPQRSTAMDSAGPASAAAKSGRKSDGGLDPVLGFKITFRRIGAGLQNLGNTCFLNSVLQCLTYTEPFAAYCHSGEHRSSCRTAGFCAMCALQNHVMNALQSTGKILSPSHLVKNLRCISRNFRNSRQEDAHEYMVNLLESMHKCCLPSGVPTESPSAYEKSLVHKIFGGRLRSQVRCLQCNYCSNTFDPFLDLSLEILKADSLTRALMHFTAKEQLDGGEKQYQCQRCKQKVRASKQLTVHKAPYVLTIHLKRFGPDVLGQKIDKKVGFEPSLDLKPFVSDPQEADLKYTLYGVLVHAGWSTHSGHYYCFVRTSSGMWHSLDDNQVRPVSEKTVLGQKAYMLFYVRDRSSAIKRSADFSQKENMLSSALGSKVICRPPSINGAMQNSERNLSISACSSAKFKTDDTSHGSTTQKESPTLQNNGQATVRQGTCLEANCEVSSDQLQLKDSVKLENPLTQMPPVTTFSQNKQATNESTHPSDSKDNGIITTSHSTGPSFTRESQQVAQEKSGLNSGCNRKVVLSVLAAQPTSNLLSQDGLHNDGTINAVSQNNDNRSKMEIDRASANKESKTVCKQLAGIKGNIKKEHFNEKSAAHQKTVPEGDNCKSTQRTGKRLLETDEYGLNTSIKTNVANGHLQQKAVAVEREKSAGDCSETKLRRKKPGRSLLNGQHFGRRKLFLTSLYEHKKKHKRSKKHRLNSKNMMKDLEDLHADDQGVSTSKATKVVDGVSIGSSKKRSRSRVITENKVLGANNAEFCSDDFVHIRNLDESMKNDTNIDDQGVSMSESNKVFDVASADSSKRSSGSRSNKKENVEGVKSGKNCNAYFVHNRNSDRSSKFDIVLAASDQSRTPLNSTGNQCEGREADAYGKGPVQKGVVSLLTSLKEANPSKPYVKNPIPPSFSSLSLSPRRNPNPSRSLLKSLSLLDRSLIGAAAGGIAGAFTYVCLLPIDTIKTKLQTKGAAKIYSSALDAAVKTFRSDGILGFYRGVSAVLVGSSTSSAIYFGTCEFGKAMLGKLPGYPPILIPPTAGAMGNVVSSAIMVPKELITQRMQAGAAGRSWEVLLRILEKDGILGLYAGYSATLLRNLPAGILSYSSFEYLKGFVLRSTGKGNLDPIESVCCGALAGAISASLTTPLDVVKTRFMTQVQTQGGNKITEMVRQILMEEGWKGLTRGVGPRVLHSACFSAIGYFAFETARLAILNQYIEQRKEALIDEAVQNQ